jgi:hypothetical protein
LSSSSRSHWRRATRTAGSPANGKLVGEVIVAVLMGLVIGNVFRIPKFVQPGSRSP